MGFHHRRLLDGPQRWFGRVIEASIFVAGGTGRRLWRGQCASEPEQIERAVRRNGGDDASIGIKTGPMTPWLMHELCPRGRDAVCLGARHATVALKLQINKTDLNDAEGAQVASWAHASGSCCALL